ncbi:MAG: insulinase family protein [Syntrophorhabdaceae bacterium]|nr:insulinase family protein [Syntrophorhabdaceae bacterium]
MLDNNLQYILDQRRGSGVVAVQIWVKVGSWHENNNIAGITHFIEHLIFKGTETIKANEMPARIEALGGSVNAFTSYDNTVYHIVIPAKAFKEGFELLADAVLNPAFPEQEVIKEKKVVLEEIKMGEDDPQRKLFKELFSLSYNDIPYGRPIIGYETTIKNMDRNDIIGYYRPHYTPDNMVVVITGDFDKEEAKRLINKYFSSRIKKQKIKTPDKETKKSTEQKERVIERDIKESYLAVSYRVPPITHDDIPSLDVLATVLGDGDSSRFNESLKYRKGIVTGVSAELFAPRYDGIFIIYSTFKGNDYGLILKEMDNELTRLIKDGINEWELIKAKNIISSSYIYSKETVQGRAMQIGKYLTLTGEMDFVDRYLKKIEAVSQEDIKRVLEKYIIGKERRLAVLAPSKKAENPYTFKLKNNMKCVVNKNKSSPSFAFRIGLIGGLKHEPEGKNGLFNIMSKMLLKGTKNRDAISIAREIDMLAGDISPFSGKNTFGLTGRFLSKDFKVVMKLIHELLTETVFKEDELEKVKDEVLSEIRQKYDDPITYTFSRFREVLFEGHPYAKDPDGKEEDIKGITINDVENLYREYITPSGAVLAISGDIDGQEIKTIFEGLYSQWKGRSNTLKKAIIKPKKKDVNVERQMLQTHIIFGFLGPGIKAKDRYPVEVMSAILSGMGGRIHRVLREDNPYAYALTFFNREDYETGSMGIYIGTDSMYLEDVKKIAIEELKRIAQEGFTEEEVKNAKNRLIGRNLISMQSNRNIVTEMCLDTIYGLGPGHFKVKPAYIEKVTRDDVNRVAKKYINLEHMIQVIVGGNNKAMKE